MFISHLPNRTLSAGGIFFEINRLSGFRPGGDAGNRAWKGRQANPGKKLRQESGFAAFPGAGENQMFFTAAPERIPDTV